MNITTKRYQLAFGLLLATLFLSYMLASRVDAQSVVFTQSMDIGTQSSQVTALQTFLATKTAHYPEGLITGYFGPLTSAAIMRFQCAEEIVCSGSAATTGYGRVGPVTRAQLNLRAGGVIGGADVSAPVVWNFALATGTNSATVSWQTSEAARGTVFYGTAFPTLIEGDPPGISGLQVGTESSIGTTHSIALPGLTPNTTYFYLTRSVDTSDNRQFTWPSTFKTAP